MRIEKIAILDEVVSRVKDSDYCFIIDHGGVTVAQFAKLRKALRAKDSDYCFIIDHGGVTVAQFAKLRKALRALDSRLLVVKNTFLGKVAKEKGWSEEVNAMFKGNSAIVTGHGEPTAVAKAIMEFVKEVPGKDQLRATLLMLLKEPATRLARVLSEKAKKGPASAEATEGKPAAEAAQ